MISINNVKASPTLCSSAALETRIVRFELRLASGAAKDCVPEVSCNRSVESLSALQELDPYVSSKTRLLEYASVMLASLNDIMIAMLSEKLTIEHYLYLRRVLDSYKDKKFAFQDLQDLMDEVILLAEIEAAKIEVRAHVRERDKNSIYKSSRKIMDL